MQSSVVKIAVAEGDVVEVGQTIIVLEAMKMEQPIKAHKAGTIANIKAVIGTTVPAGTLLMEIED
jgi:acetyl-CoA/propionyl-CoA carboxylase biotin carboxyl carrier protein